MAEYYQWFKALHIISVVAWMAGMLYLPRLYVYHADAEIGSDKSETFKIMERRLLRAITNPAMVSSFIFGGLMLATPGMIDWDRGWIWVKIAMILALSGVHGLYAPWRRDFEAGRKTRPAKFYRMWNDLPTTPPTTKLLMAVRRPS